MSGAQSALGAQPKQGPLCLTPRTLQPPHALSDCLHYLSREPLGFNTTLLNQLVYTTTQVMKLNPEGRALNHTLQQGCW